MKKDIRQALRMTGHLLEHHPTTGSAARNGKNKPVASNDKQASCWSIIGAAQITWLTLKPEQDDDSIWQFWDAVDKFLGGNAVDMWEGYRSTNASRLAIARKLQNA